MKKFSLLISTLAVMAISALSASPGFAENDFCWRDTETRGVGTVPSACPEGRERIGLLCYSKCGPNMQRFGFDCHSVCPSGMRDDGLFCRAAEYGRGAGYPWKFGDPLSDSGMFQRCEADQGKGNCEKWGAVVYPKCKPGYSAFGCCICRPNTPNCQALNLNPGIDLSCAKKITIGDPAPGICASGQQADAGLCYPACKPGLDGVGPVCWGKPPTGWVNCGMGAAKDSETCTKIVFGQVTSVGKLALEVASLAVEIREGGSPAEIVSTLKEKFAGLVAAFDKIRNMPAVKGAIGNYSNLSNALGPGKHVATAADDSATLLKESKSASVEDIDRVSEEIAGIVETSGIEDVAASYAYPKCSQL